MSKKPCAACADVAEWKAICGDEYKDDGTDYYCRKHDKHPWERSPR